MALVELAFADKAALAQSGRNFDCSKCRPNVKALRRCGEAREDFTEEDGSAWPIILHPGGASYGFCPGKATWDSEATGMVGMLRVAAETGMMLEAGGIADQPDWWIDLLSWFLPSYDQHKFASRVRSVLGDGKKGVGPKR